MKILLVHNFYGSTAPSGENTAYTAEANLLRSYGHTVTEYTRHSDEIMRRGIYGTLMGAFSTVWNPFTLRELKRRVNLAKPDVIHIHNTFPILSPSVFYASRGEQVPTVMTMHNYRIGCSAATALRNEQPCMLCLEKKSVLPALRYGCYRNSRLATLPVSAMIALHNGRDTWRNNVDAFITLTNFQRDKMVQFGIPDKSLFVKPHFLQDPPRPVPWRDRDAKFVFIGRLYAAKGVHILIEAWKQWGKEAPRLDIIGDGPMKNELVRSVNSSESAGSISFTGNIPREEALKRLSTAKLLIVPSLCYEGFPMVVQEAYALGVPVAASNIGSLPSLVEDGVTGILFEPGNPEDVRTRVRALLAGDEKLEKLGTNARREFEDKYTSDRNHEMLMGIYRSAVNVRSLKLQ